MVPGISSPLQRVQPRDCLPAPATHSQGTPCGPSRLRRHLDSAKLCHDCIVQPILFQSLSRCQADGDRPHLPSRHAIARAPSRHALGHHCAVSLLRRTGTTGPERRAATDGVCCIHTPSIVERQVVMSFCAKPSGLQRLNSCLKAQVAVDRWVGLASRVNRSARFAQLTPPSAGDPGSPQYRLAGRNAAVLLRLAYE